jgi:hypothetical protein
LYASYEDGSTAGVHSNEWQHQKHTVSEGYASVTVFSSNAFRMSVFIGVDCSMDFRMSMYVIVFGPLEMSA